MQLNSKQKSNIIFWGIFILFTAFLFLTPWGESTRNWLSSLTLTSPNMEESSITNSEDRLITTDWNLESTTGEQIWISEIEQPIFLNIWATWCPPCRAELPSIIDLHEHYKDKVTFLLVSPGEPIQKLQKFANDKGYQMPFYTETSYTPNSLQTSSYPTTFIIDKDKNITHKMVGSHNWDSEEVHALLDQIVSK